MAELIDLLPVTKNHNDDPYYAVDDLRKHATTVINLEGRGLLAVLEDGIHISFVVTTFAEGPSTQDGQIVGPELHERVFHGSGPSGALRELRHTFWGEQDNGGYIFYPSAKLITDAFHQLNRWFDCDG
jgi:hypothetical protein